MRKLALSDDILLSIEGACPYIVGKVNSGSEGQNMKVWISVTPCAFLMSMR